MHQLQQIVYLGKPPDLDLAGIQTKTAPLLLVASVDKEVALGKSLNKVVALHNLHQASLLALAITLGQERHKNKRLSPSHRT